MSKSLDRRRDVRTADQFKKDIKDASQREKLLIELWAKEMRYRGHTVSYKDNGIDNSGEFVELSDSRPDYEVTVDGNTYLLEVKSNPYSFKQTFKIFDLQTYVKLGAKMLLFFGLGQNKTLFDEETTRWAMIESSSIDKMLKVKPHQTGDSKWGFKKVLILYPGEYDTYFKTEKLTHKGNK